MTDASANSVALTTKTGKTIADFIIPAGFLEDKELLSLVMLSESMNDKERQYWFNLYEVMTPSQVEKLRGILTRERDKLAEIESKYGPKKEKTPEEIEAEKAQAMQMAQMRQSKQNEIKAQEKEQKEAEQFDEDSILGELDKI